jgi:hypothetical protein
MLKLEPDKGNTMRTTLATLLLAALAAISVSASSKSSGSTANSTGQTATSTAAADNVASSVSPSAPAPAAAGGGSGTPPVYPGAVPGVRPEGVGLKAPPAQVKAYSTPDDFATVKAWYRAHLKSAPEMAQPGMEKTEDAFLVGRGASGAVVMIQSFKGKTWILIGPPM